MFIFKDKAKKQKQSVNKDTIQELLHYKEITPDGLIILENNRYSRMMEIYPTNLFIKSPEEQATVWEEYRNTISAIKTDWTTIIQTRKMEISEHLEILNEESKEIEKDYPKLFDYCNTIKAELSKEYQEKDKKNKKTYIILKVDAEEIKNLDGGLSVDNAALEALLGSASNKKNKYSTEELKNIAMTELRDAQNIIYSGLLRAGGIIAKPMNKLEVLDYINHSINRDLANVYSVDDIHKAGVFNLVPESLTLDLFFSRLQLETAAINEYDTEYYYEDEEMEFAEKEAEKSIDKIIAKKEEKIS